MMQQLSYRIPTSVGFYYWKVRSDGLLVPGPEQGEGLDFCLSCFISEKALCLSPPLFL